MGFAVDNNLMVSSVRSQSSPDERQAEPQRFVFDAADWGLYEHVSQTLQDRHVFITFYKGRLEIVTVSLLHERIVGLISALIRVLAEETDTSLCGAGMATLRREDMGEGVQADACFYIANEARMRGKKELDLMVDPPPDLAVEVEVTHRLGERKTIYQDLGVPEIWRHFSGRLVIMRKNGDAYETVDRSPTFPQLSPEEIAGFVAAGLTQDETALTKAFRRRVREAIGTH